MDERESASRHGRRGVLNDARRKVEHALLMVDAAEELANAVEELLAATVQRPNPPDLSRLQASIKAYRRLQRATEGHL